MLVVPVSIGTLITVYVVVWLVWLFFDALGNAADRRFDRQCAEREKQQQEKRERERYGDQVWNCLAWSVIEQELRDGDFDACGCPKYFSTASTNCFDCLSFQAVRDNLGLVKAAHTNPKPENRQWMLMSVEYNWHDNRKVCAHTGLPIPSKEEIDTTESNAEIDAQFEAYP